NNSLPGHRTKNSHPNRWFHPLPSYSTFTVMLLRNVLSFRPANLLLTCPECLRVISINMHNRSYFLTFRSDLRAERLRELPQSKTLFSSSIQRTTVTTRAMLLKRR